MNQVYRLLQHDQVVAELAAPLDGPPETLHWARRRIEQDLRTYASAPARSYLEIARECGRTVSEAVDARVQARLYREPTRSYKEHLLDVLREDEELAQAYRESAV